MSAAGGATLPRARRLRRREEYVTALAGKATALRRHFSVHVVANALGSSRIGIIVSKKNAPRAVDRNRIKRLVREAFRQGGQVFGGHDLVVMARRCPSRDGWEGARAELQALFGQLALQLRQRGS